MGRWSRGRNLLELRFPWGAGNQFKSIPDWESLAVMGAVPFNGSVGSSLENSSTETTSDCHECELVREAGNLRPWKSIEELKLATLKFNYQVSVL